MELFAFFEIGLKVHLIRCKVFANACIPEHLFVSISSFTLSVLAVPNCYNANKTRTSKNNVKFFLLICLNVSEVFKKKSEWTWVQCFLIQSLSSTACVHVNMCSTSHQNYDLEKCSLSRSESQINSNFSISRTFGAIFLEHITNATRINYDISIKLM